MSGKFEIAQNFTGVGNQIGLLVDAIGYVAQGVASKAPIRSAELTGIPTAPTAAVGTNSTQIATTAFVQSSMSVTQVKPALKAEWTSSVVGSPLPVSLTSVTTDGTTALWIYISGTWRQISLV